MSRMIGIDLGTTRCCAAVMEGRVPRVIPNPEGELTTPTVVGFMADGERLVGEVAKRQAHLNPENTVYGVKRLIGRKFDSPECRTAQRFAPFALVPAANGDVQVQAAGRVYSLPEISSFMLAKLKAAAEDDLDERVESAIITVPAYFNDPQRQATRDAALIVGFEYSRILNEPTAAALVRGLERSDSGAHFIAVYDLGGGTFDITILEICEGLCQVRATGGNSFLGGDDFDERVMGWFLSEYQQEGFDIDQTPALLHQLRDAAERAKRHLSLADTTEIAITCAPRGQSEARYVERSLDRRQYESLTRDLLLQTIEPCLRSLADAGLRPDQLDDVLLVGGQSRAPGVVALVHDIFGREPSTSINADEGVAAGAAISAAIIEGSVKDLVLLDVISHTVGIETRDGTFTPFVERNTPIPTRHSRMFSTAVDNQSRVDVHVLQGESLRAADNTSLAKFEMADIPPAPRGTPQIEVDFEVDVNGIVSVSATDQGTARAQSLIIRTSGGLSQAEVSQLAAETRAFQAQREARAEQERVARQLQGMVDSTVQSLQAFEDRLPPADRDRILDVIRRAKESLEGEDLDRRRACLADMGRAAESIVRAMLKP